MNNILAYFDTQLEYLQQRNAELEKQVVELERVVGKERLKELDMSRSNTELQKELTTVDKLARKYPLSYILYSVLHYL